MPASAIRTVLPLIPALCPKSFGDSPASIRSSINCRCGVLCRGTTVVAMAQFVSD